MKTIIVDYLHFDLDHTHRIHLIGIIAIVGYEK